MLLPPACNSVLELPRRGHSSPPGAAAQATMEGRPRPAPRLPPHVPLVLDLTWTWTPGLCDADFNTRYREPRAPLRRGLQYAARWAVSALSSQPWPWSCPTTAALWGPIREFHRNSTSRACEMPGGGCLTDDCY